MILVPVFVLVTLGLRHPGSAAAWGLLIFIVASVTDFFDGYLARKGDIVSNFGKIMDPLADKLLVIAALIVLYIMPGKIVAAWVIFAILVREVLVSFLREYHAKRGFYIPANIWGKAKAFLQMIGICLALYYHALHGFCPYAFANVNDKWCLGLRIIFWVLALVTVASGLTYMRPVQGSKS
jgi:CDP-diacylglycerol--glycerol-3-phosphate 3-phosphatidyltransferase